MLSGAVGVLDITSEAGVVGMNDPQLGMSGGQMPMEFSALTLKKYCRPVVRPLSSTSAPRRSRSARPVEVELKGVLRRLLSMMANDVRVVAPSPTMKVYGMESSVVTTATRRPAWRSRSASELPAKLIVVA
jgi:hypothetical protein